MFKRKHIHFAAGYPQTIKVAAKRIGGLLSRDKDRTVVVVNGASCFTIPTGRYQSLKVAPCDTSGQSGVWGLVGHTQSGSDEVAAKFGSEEGALAAFDAVVKASTGIGGSGWGWLTSAAVAVVGVFAITLFLAVVGASSQGAQAASGPAATTQRLGANTAPGEPTLEELEKLAASHYEFKPPKVAAPKDEPPVLACTDK